jgi:DNA-binding transcriptional regulator YhcF (GntR family)
VTESWRRPPTTSPLAFEVDPRGELPPFEQLKAQVIGRISAGTLIAGTRLPAVRTLAADLGIAPNTVARAYRELEAAGFLATHGRNGTIVTAASDDPAAALQLEAQGYAARARELGIAAEEALSFVERALGR